MNVRKPTKKAKRKIIAPLKSKLLPFSPTPGSPLAVFENIMRASENSLDQAQELIYDAWEAPTQKEAVALAKKALSISGNCADAFNLLAEMTAKSPAEAVELYRKGVEAGERAIGKQTFKRDAGFFWGNVEARPFMRALAGLAQSLWKVGDHEKALIHFREALRFNTNDNQGIRFLLMPRLIELDKDRDAEKLFKQFKEDEMAAWAYSKALLDFRKHGASLKASKSLETAFENNQHIPFYLLGHKKVPPSIPDYYGVGDENEAVFYVNENQRAWEVTSDAIHWLKEKAKIKRNQMQQSIFLD